MSRTSFPVVRWLRREDFEFGLSSCSDSRDKSGLSEVGVPPLPVAGGLYHWSCWELLTIRGNKKLSNFQSVYLVLKLPWWLRQKKKRCGKLGLDPSVRKIPWRREWQPTPVFLLGISHGQRSLVVYSSWSCKELDMTEVTNTLKPPAVNSPPPNRC